MAVLLFEGWDMHSRWRDTGISPSGLWDHNSRWSHGGSGNHPRLAFIDGYLGGQAFQWGRTEAITAGYTETTEVRVAWYGKIPIATEITDHRNFLNLYHSSGSTVSLRVISTADGSVVCGVITSGGATSIGTFVFDSDWAHYEFYVNAMTGKVIVRKNGETVIDETITLASGTNFNKIGLARCGALLERIEFAWDHLIITDGVSLRDTGGFHAVAVVWHGFGKGTSTFTQIRTRIEINGTSYFGPIHTLNMAGGNKKYAPGASNVIYDNWMTNPDTSAVWENEINIDRWGFCRLDDTGGWLIIPSAFLSYVVMTTEGVPLVKYAAPGTAFLIDDTWVRTHADRPWNAHIDNYPRKMPPWDYSLIPLQVGIGANNPNPFHQTSGGEDWSAYTYDELWSEDYLGVTGPGCITFTANPPEPPTFYGGTGLAFAEEYRASYKDWQSIIDGGEDFVSYFISGYKIHGEGNKKFQNNYLTMNFETDILGSAYVQGVWDYALSNEPNDGMSRSDTGRWGTTQQIYGPRNSVDYKHAFSKLKIRGHGKALQLKVKSEDGKPFYINGWAMFVSGNSTT